jgi:hypothetical protein
MGLMIQLWEAVEQYLLAAIVKSDYRSSNFESDFVATLGTGRERLPL